MANSDVVIGKVVVLQGHAYIRTADGARIELKLGDPVHEGDVIITGPGAVVQLGFTDGESYVVHQNETITLDASVFADHAPDANNAALTTHTGQIKDITDAIASGNDFDQMLEPAAAGLGGGGDGNSGHSFVQLVRISEATSPLSVPNNGEDGQAQQPNQSAADNANARSNADLGATPTAKDVAVSDDVTAAHAQPVTIHLSGSDTASTIVSFTINDLPANGTLYLADGKTLVTAGEVITASNGGADVVFVPAAGTTALTTTFHYSATDSVGITSAPATGTINVEAAPTITIDPVHVINGAEAASSSPIAVTGTVSSNVPVGDTVTLTVDGHSYTGTVAAGGTYSIGIPGNVLAGAGTDSIHAAVSVTDSSGNVSSATVDRAYTVELGASQITVAIDPIATINGTTAASSAPVAITGTVSANVPVGDGVTLTVGGLIYTGTVQAGGTYSIGVPGNVVVGAATNIVHVTVSATDAAGNVATASADQPYTVELTAPAITIGINPIATVNGAEAASSAPIAITGTVSANVPVGDAVTLTVDGHSYTGTVQAGGTYSIPVPVNVLVGAATDSIHVAISSTDAAGNTASASATQSYAVELTAPAINISVDPIATVNAAQANFATPIAITGTVSGATGSPIAGDTVTLTVGGQNYTGTVHADGTYSISVPGNVLAGATVDSVQVSVSGTDAAGNTASASASQSYHVELTAPAINVGIDPIAVITPAEGASTSPIAITGTVTSATGGPIAGDTVTLTVGGQTYTGTVQPNGTYSIGVPGTVLAGAPSDSVHVTVSGVDSVGNVSTGSANQSYAVGSVAPAGPDAPTVAITTDANHDGVISTVELNGATTVQATVTLDAAGQTVLNNGGTVQITVTDHNAVQNLNLHLNNNGSLVDGSGNTYSYSAGVITLTEAAPGNGNGITVSATETDSSGNVSSAASASATETLTAATVPDTPTVSITTDANHDGIISATELNGASTVQAAVTLDAAGQTVLNNGGTVQITVTDNNVVQNLSLHLNNSGNLVDGSGNTYSYNAGVITLTEAAPGNGNGISVSATETDSSGNVSNQASATAVEQTTATPITIGIDPIATVNSAEAASAAPIAITGTVSANVPVGDTVTLTVDGHSYTGTVQAGGTYSIGVPGNVLASAATDSIHATVSSTDAAGNVATASADQAYVVELNASSITIGIDPIATVNGIEAASAAPVAITGTVSANVPVGDTVTLTVDGHSYTGTVQAGGTYSIGVPGNVLASAATDSIHATVSSTDAAGNVATASADQAYVVELNASSITIGIDPIATVNGIEAASAAPVAITGTVSANVPVGDTVTLTVDGHSYTGTVQAGGTYSIGVPGNILAGAATDSIHATVSATDASGNVATASADQAYTVELTAPAITIGIDPIATVNGAEAASAAPVAITGTVSANVPVGDTVTLTVDGHSYTGTVQAGGTYSIGVPGNVLAGAATDSIHATVSSTDAAGNVATASADQAYVVELNASSITIGIDPIATVNGAEAASAAPVAITGTVSANVPVGDTVTLTVDGHNYTGTVQAGGTYSIGVPGNVLAGATMDSIHATVSSTDAAGNVATASADQAYTVELAAPAIAIGIDPIATVNGAEAASSASIAITGTVSANVPVGDTVTLTVDGHNYTGTVQVGGTYSIGVPGNVLAGATTDSIHATVSSTDAAGNVATASADQAYTVELAAPAIAIGIDPIATVNGVEAASSAPIAITGTVSANVPVGDTVTLTVDGHNYTGTVVAGGTYSIGVPGNVLAGAATDSIHVTVSSTDAAGNVATASADQAYGVELAAPAIAISIDPITTVNGAEAASSTPIAITGTVSANIPVGDTVTLTVDGHNYTGTVAAGGTYSIGVPGNILASAATDSIHATVSSTDAAGNVATASADQTYTVELNASSIAIAINPIATVNGAEAASSTPVAITGTVSANVPVGDTVTLTVDGHNYTGTVQAGGTYSIGVPGNILAGAATDSIHAAVSSTDAAGNVATASADQAYTVELTAPAITIGIDPIATVNGAEAASSTPVAITGTVSANVPVGDTVTLTVDGHNYTGTVQAGGTYSIGVPGNILAGAATDSIHATVSATDAAGNVATASADQAYTVELTAPAITIGIDPIATVNGTEAVSSTPVTITGTVSANVPVGDTVTLTVDGHSYTGTVQAGGTYSIGVPGNVLASAATDSIHATVSSTDAAGNVATASADQAYTVELSASSITIGIDPIATVNGAEAASSAPVAITGTVSANVPVGDKVTLTVDGHNYTGTVQAGGTYSIGVPGNILAGAATDSIHATVSATDAAGNTATASADQAYAVELTAPAISIAINSIPTVNGAEAASSAPIAITGTVSSNVPVGDTVTLSVGGQTYTGTVQTGGTYSIAVPGNILAGATTDSIHATVSATDAAGNTATASADQVYIVELTAPAITIGINSIPTINGAEAASANPIQVTGTVSSNVPVGDTVTLSVGGHTYTGTVQTGGTYSIGVPGNILAGATTDSVHAAVSATDAAGNTATASADQAYTVELAAPAITIGINSIPTVNGAEAASANPIAITGTVSANVPVGDTVTLSVGGHTYTGTVQTGGTYNIGVPGNILAGATTDSVHATVSATDAAGNTATASANQTYTVELAAPAISIAINSIPTVNGAEAASANPIQVTGTVSSNVPVGDAVTLTVGGQTYTGTVQTGGTYSIGVPGNVLAGATTDSVHATVSTTDAAGNTATASADQAYTVELAAPAITIGIDSIPTVNGAEAASSNPIAITGTVSSNVPVSDTVTLSVDGHTYTGTVQTGGTYSIGVPGNILASATTDSVHAAVSTTDAAGNTATASADQAYTVELSASAITIGINNIATINGAEAASSNPIQVTGTVSSNVPVGDTVTLSVGGHTYTGTVQTGGTYSIGVPGNILASATTDSVHATVSATDAAGNTATASADQAYTVELTAPAISIAINNIPTVNGVEAASANPIQVTGTVSSNVPVGDTVTLSVGGQTYTGTVQTGGTYSIGVPGNVLAGATTDSVHATVSATDAAGNTATASANQAYTVELAAPAITIGINSIATVNGAEAASSAPIAITGTVSSNVPVGDTVTLSVGGQTYTGTVQTGGTYSIGVPGNVLAGATTDSVHATVSATDAAGNTATASANQTYTVELAASAITIGINSIATVNGAEAASSAPIAITGTVSSNVPVGDTVTLSVGGQTYTGTVQTGGTYSIGVPGNVLAGATTDSVHATVSATDAAGNTATASANQTYTVELAAPAISIAINNIPTVNGAEAASSNPIAITGTVSSNIPVGDIVTLSVGGHTYTGTVQTGGTYSIGVPGNILAGATTDSVHATVSATDAAGNTATASADQAYTVELAAPAISIAINSIPTVNGAEAASANPIAITGTVSANVPVGDTVTLSVGGHTYTGTVQTGGTYSIGVPGNILAGATTDSVHATVSATDAAGNTATASADQAYTVELTAPAITIGINSIATVNGAEAASSAPIAITGTVSSNVPVGDTVTLSVGGQTYTGTVQTGGTYSIGVPGNVLAGATTDSVHATVSATDAAGNTATASANQAYTVELAAPAITIGINSIATVNGAEAASSAPIAITGTVSSNVPVGDTVTLSVGGQTYTGTVQTGGTYSIGVPGNVLAGASTDSVHATVSATDAAGNTATASANQTYTVELAAPAITIGINSIATVNGAEAASSNPIAITGTVSSNVPVGDTVTLSVSGHTYTGTVQTGGTYSIGVPGNILASATTDSVHATVSATDAAGNTATASANQTYTVELVAPAITIGINSIAPINVTEAASSNPVPITGTVSSNVPVGDTVTLTVNGHSYTGTVQTGGTYSIGVPGNVLATATTDSVAAAVSMTDAAGNVASASATQTYSVYAVAPPTPTVSITTDTNQNGVINATELNGSANVQATVTLNSTGQTDLSSGGTVQVTVNDAGTTQTLNLHLVNNGTGNVLVDGSGNVYSYSAGVITLTEKAPGDGNSIKVTATETDLAGNVSTQGTATAIEHVSLPDTPVVSFLADGLTSQYYGVNDSKIASGTTANILAEATLDAQGTPNATFIADLLNFGLNTTSTTPTTSNEVIGNNLGTSGNLVKWLGTDATNLQLASTYGTTSQAIVTMNGVVSLAAGTYTLKINADDGYQIKIDGNIVATVNADQSLAGSTYSFAVGATAGNLHTIQIIYWDQGGQASFQASLATNTPLNVAQSNTVTATVTLDQTDQTDLVNGGSVLITASNGTSLTLHENTSGQLVDSTNLVYTYQNGVIYLPLATPASGTSLTVSASVTDQYANTSGTGSNSYHLPTAAVTIDTDANHDGYLNAQEISAETTAGVVQAHVAIDPTSLSNNGSAVVTVIDNGVTTTLNVSQTGVITGAANGVSATYSNGSVAVSFANPGNGNSVTVSATESDQYGNMTPVSSVTVVEDITAAPAPTVSITTDTNQDGYISAAELNGSATVNATITLSSTAQTDLTSGGSVQISISDAGVTQSLSLHMSGTSLVDAAGNTYSYSGGVITLTETAPGNGNHITVSATVTDVAGNVSPVSNAATAQQDIIDAPAVAIAYPTAMPSTGLTWSTWVNNTTVNNQLYTTKGNNGDGTNPATLINTLSSTSVPAATASTTITTFVSGSSLTNANIAAGTASEVNGLVYLQAGHAYTFTNASGYGEDDSFALVIGGQVVGTATYGTSSGAFSGTFTAAASGWYTLAAYHDNQNGPGMFDLNVSDNGATAVALSTSSLDMVQNVAALTSAGISLNTEVVSTNTTSITTTAANSSGAGTVSTTVTGGYYTEKPIASVTLDSSDQSVLTSGGTMHVTASDGTNVTLHWNGSAMVDASGNSYAYTGGILSLPISANPTTLTVTVSATVYDSHGVASLTSTMTEIYSGSNSLTELVGGDTFKFELSANGTAGTPTVNTISAFNSNAASNGGDVLHLADVLQGATASNITNYLHFTSSTTNGVATTVVHVSETGGYASGYSAAQDTLQIALTNVDLVHSAGATLTDAAIIQSLLNKGKLVE